MFATRHWAQLAAEQFVNFGGHDEITFGQAVDLMCPQGDFRLAPGQENVGMMSLFFRHGAHAIHEVKRLFEVRKGETASDVMFVDDVPLRHLLMKRVQFFFFERRHSAAAGNTGLAGKRGHRNIVAIRLGRCDSCRADTPVRRF